MARLRQYRFGIQPWGLLLFFLIMLPNFIWFALPAENDVLRLASRTPALDGVGSVFQVCMAAATCLLARRDVGSLAFLAYGAARRHGLLLLFAGLFTLCHGVYGPLNFLT